MIGRLVCSKAGRDKDKLMVVVSETQNGLLVADGKERTLERPKLKNIKHISLLRQSLDKEQFSSNRALRKALAEIKGELSEMEE